MAEVSAGMIRRSAMGLLARREYSFAQLVSRLEAKYADYAGLVFDEVERLRQEGLQSDERFCESLVRSRVNRGRGPVRIRMELRQQGIPEELIDQALLDADVDWAELIQRVKSGKFGAAPVLDLKQKARVARFLQQRGFTFKQINSTI